MEQKKNDGILKWVLIIIAAFFLFIMVIMPLGMVVAGSFARGLNTISLLLQINIR